MICSCRKRLNQFFSYCRHKEHAILEDVGGHNGQQPIWNHSRDGI